MGSGASSEDLITLIQADDEPNVSKTKHLEALFKIYDTDDSGVITGFETNGIVRDILEYILEHNVSKDCNEKSVNCIKGKIIGKIIDIFDKNSDGKISKDEFFEGFSKCLDIKIVKVKPTPSPAKN